MKHSVLGVYSDMDKALATASGLKKEGVEDITILSPTPISEEIEHALGKRKDPIRFFSFFGGLFGFIAGMLFVFGTSAMYVLPRGGRPIFSFPPTLLLSYETLILIGVLFTLVGFIVTARLFISKDEPYHERTGEDCFGILVYAERGKLDNIEQVIKDSGALDVRRSG